MSMEIVKRNGVLKIEGRVGGGEVKGVGRVGEG